MNYIVYQNPNNNNIELLIPCLDVNLYFDEIVKDIPKNDLGEIPDYIIVNEIPKFIETYDLRNKLIKRNRNKLINFKLNEWRNLRKPILQKLDIEFMKAFDFNDTNKLNEIRYKKQVLRDITDTDISMLNDDELENFIPNCLKE